MALGLTSLLQFAQVAPLSKLWGGMGWDGMGWGGCGVACLFFETGTCYGSLVGPELACRLGSPQTCDSTSEVSR